MTAIQEQTREHQLDLVDLLKICDPGVLPFEGARSMKLVRHADPRWDLEKLFRSRFFEHYQARQARDLFGNCQYIVAFIGERGPGSRFIGVYEVLGRLPDWLGYPEGFPYADMPLSHFVYDLRKLHGFESLENRLVIDWGSGTRSWCQWLASKPVIELAPAGQAREFPGYLDFVIDFDELDRIVRNPDANRLWHIMLRAVAGIYLITDTVTGDQYVGSAYGDGGIMGRWSSYAKTKHGGNKRLRDLLDEHPERHGSFAFSILRTLPRTHTDREVIAVESLYKRKLGSRAFGLNGN